MDISFDSIIEEPKIIGGQGASTRFPIKKLSKLDFNSPEKSDVSSASLESYINNNGGSGNNGGVGNGSNGNGNGSSTASTGGSAPATATATATATGTGTRQRSVLGRSKEMLTFEHELMDLLNSSHNDSISAQQRRAIENTLHCAFDLFQCTIEIPRDGSGATNKSLIDAASVRLFIRMQGVVSSIMNLVVGLNETGNNTTATATATAMESTMVTPVQNSAMSLAKFGAHDFDDVRIMSPKMDHSTSSILSRRDKLPIEYSSPLPAITVDDVGVGESGDELSEFSDDNNDYDTNDYDADADAGGNSDMQESLSFSQLGSAAHSPLYSPSHSRILASSAGSGSRRESLRNYTKESSFDTSSRLDSRFNSMRNDRSLRSSGRYHEMSPTPNRTVSRLKAFQTQQQNRQSFSDFSSFNMSQEAIDLDADYGTSAGSSNKNLFVDMSYDRSSTMLSKKPAKSVHGGSRLASMSLRQLEDFDGNYAQKASLSFTQSLTSNYQTPLPRTGSGSLAHGRTSTRHMSLKYPNL